MSQQLIKAVESADSADGLLEAVKALAAAKTETAIPTLIKVLGYNNPGAAVAAVDGLIDLGEVTVPHLLKQVDSYNYGARAWAIRVFAGIGDPQALDLLIYAATQDFSLSVRRAAAKGLGKILWHKLPQDQILPTKTKVINTLLQVAEDGEWVVRYAAVVGLQNIATSLNKKQTDLIEPILTLFQTMTATDPEIAIRARIQLAIQTLSQHQ